MVFDATNHGLNENSLNEELSPGLALQHDISQIVSRWRRYEIAFCAGIKKMFRRILIDDKGQRYQHIFWRETLTEPISIYKLHTVTYGTTSAPFFSIRTLHQLCKDENNNFPEASEVLAHDIYVDDIFGADTKEEAIHLQRQLFALLASGGFVLRDNGFPTL